MGCLSRWFSRSSGSDKLTAPLVQDAAASEAADVGANSQRQNHPRLKRALSCFSIFVLCSSVNALTIFLFCTFYKKQLCASEIARGDPACDPESSAIINPFLHLGACLPILSVFYVLEGCLSYCLCANVIHQAYPVVDEDEDEDEEAGLPRVGVRRVLPIN